MLERLKTLFGKAGGTALTQPQREAMVDLLLWIMYADRLLAVPEHDRIDRLGTELGWTSVTPFSQYVDTTVARVREVLSDEDRAAALLEDLYARLGTDAVRRQAYDACRSLAEADGQVAEDEARLLDRIRTRFGL